MAESGRKVGGAWCKWWGVSNVLALTKDGALPFREGDVVAHNEAVADGHVGQTLLGPLELLEQHEVTRHHDDLSGVGAHLARRPVAGIGC